MSEIELRGVAKSYGRGKNVIDGLDLTVDEGSFTVLVGPSGCGKSTTLRMIAGLEEPTSGEIKIGGHDVTHVPPGERGVAMVFQSYAIYPTMTVAKNIEYGLRNTGIAKAERREMVEQIAETVGLADHLRKPPGELSGGERQRVALARAMVRKPAVFLMDEPLSNLDARLRQQMRTELVDLHARLGATFVYVTHDQVEAMSMATRIVLMEGGRIMQEATPHDMYHEPANVFSARFIGSPAMNVIRIDGSAQKPVTAPRSAVSAGFRPEHCSIIPAGGEPAPGTADGGIILSGRILASEYLGAETVDRVELDSGERVSVRTFGFGHAHDRAHVRVVVPGEQLHWFDNSGARAKVSS